MKYIQIFLCLITGFVPCINVGNYLQSPNKISKMEIDSCHETKSYTCVATMYYPVASQCDSDPFITAGMYKIPKDASSKHWIALSRDMLSRWGGEFNYGDYVEIKGTNGKDGIYMVVDTMNKRYKRHIDFLETEGTAGYKYTNVTITKISKT